MSKKVSTDTLNREFVVGRKSGMAFNAVEGLRESPRVARLRRESDLAGETGEARRARIRRAFADKTSA
jgi:hypothetical protein